MRNFTIQELQNNYDLFCNAIASGTNMDVFIAKTYGKNWFEDLIDTSGSAIKKKADYNYRRLNEDFYILDEKYLVKNTFPYLLLAKKLNLSRHGLYTTSFVYLGNDKFLSKSVNDLGIIYPIDSVFWGIYNIFGDGFFQDNKYIHHGYETILFKDDTKVYVHLNDLLDIKTVLGYDSNVFTKEALDEKLLNNSDEN